MSDAQADTLAKATPLVHERMNTLAESVKMLGFLFAEEVTFDETDRANLLNDEGLSIVAASRDALAAVSQWSTESIEAALRGKLLEEMALKPRVAFGPVRVAITGSRISPPLFESMEILGREQSLARLERALG